MHEELLDRIAVEFRHVPRPREITKSVARALDDDWNVSASRSAELRKKDEERHWSDLSDEEIEAYSDILTFLDAEGYHFYLPAYMSYAVRRYHESVSFALDAPIFACANANGRFSLFTPTQIRCVLDFLTLCACNDDHFNATWAAYAVDYVEHNAPKAESGKREVLTPAPHTTGHTGP